MMGNQIESDGFNPGRRRSFADLGRIVFGIAILKSFAALAQKNTRLDYNRIPYDKVAELIRRFRQPVDYNEIWPEDVPVLCLGEEHFHISDDSELITGIPEFKKTGITHIGLEGFHESQQDIIDGYFAGIKSEQDVRNLMDNWDYGEGPKEYMLKLFAEAKDKGIRVLAIDLSFPGNADIKWVGQNQRRRNENWARVIKAAVKKEPRARVIIFGGGNHFGYGASGENVNEMLAKEGIRSRVAQFTGFEKPLKPIAEMSPTDIQAMKLGEKITYAALQLGLSNERFMVPLMPQDTDVAEGDFIIHLPQKEIIDHDISDEVKREIQKALEAK